MENHINQPPKIPNLPLNSQTLTPNSPSHPPIFTDFDTYSPLSPETTPTQSPDQPYSIQPQNDELNTVPVPRYSSLYSWSQPWNGSTWEMEPKATSSSSTWGIEPKTTSSSSTWEIGPKTTSSSSTWTDKYDFVDCLNTDSDELFNVVSGEDKMAIVGAGFSNLGNTCFLNSILQCFVHTVPLLQGLIAFDHKVLCSSYSLCVICALCELIELSLTSTGRNVSPWKFVDNLSYISSSFQRFQQEDAHEFLQCFLDRLESCCNDLRPLSSLTSDSNNFVKKVFGGRLVSKLKCCNCGHCSDTYEPSIDLSLEIEDVDNLISALESFTKVEKLEDPDTQFTCEECKEKVSIEKQLLLDQAPSISAFHLKRFKNDGSFVEKIDKCVEFPLELDMSPFTGCSKANDEELKYDLYAVVVHIGFSSNSGHYYCFVRLSPGAWYKFDDSKVVRVREEYVLSQEAYILFYAKKGTPWFSDFIETQKQFVEQSLLNTSPKSVLDCTDVYSSCSTSTVNSNDCDVKEVGPTEDPFPHNLIGLKENKVDGNESKDDPLSCHADHVVSPSVLKESNRIQQFGVGNGFAEVTPKAQPRSVSPEICRKDSSDIVKSADMVTCKRRLNPEMEDMGRKQACALVKKSSRGSRAQQLTASLRGSNSESSINKKRSRLDAPTNTDRNSTGQHRSSNGFGSRVFAAASNFR